MRIGVDGYNLAMPKGTGVATYAFGLVEALHGLGHQVDGVFGLDVPADTALRETVFFDLLQRPAAQPRKVSRYKRALRFVRSFPPPVPREIALTAQVEKGAFAGVMPAFDGLISAAALFENAFRSFQVTGRMVSLRLRRPPDVMHWTYPVPILVEGARNIYTLHDLVPLKLPYTTLDDKRIYGKMVGACISGAAQICTVSESSKRDIIDFYGVEPSRVTNTFQTATSLKTSDDGGEADAKAVERIFGLTRRAYFLYFGAIEPKKNIGRLIEAYLSLGSNTPLVIVGGRSWQSEGELSLIPDGGSGGAPGTYRGHRNQSIIRLDHLARELLFKLVRGAKAVVFPSLYEGFGLPVLEAMRMGTPVVSSNTSSLPEVAGDAGLLVDPYDVAELQEAMRRVDTDEALCRTMAARGLEQAKSFSQERYQQRLTELYRAAMAPR